MWSDARQLCASHGGRHHRGPLRLELPWTLRPRARQPSCTCAAYAWPHRPGGGDCRWPDPPTHRVLIPAGTHGHWRRRVHEATVKGPRVPHLLEACEDFRPATLRSSGATAHDGTYRFATVATLELRRAEAAHSRALSRTDGMAGNNAKHQGVGTNRRRSAPRLVPIDDSWPVF